MKLNISRVKPFPIAGLGLAVAILTGPIQSQEQSATQEKEAAPAPYSVIDLGVVGGPPGGPYVISNNGLEVALRPPLTAECMPSSGTRD